MLALTAAALPVRTVQRVNSSRQQVLSDTPIGGIPDHSTAHSRTTRGMLNEHPQIKPRQPRRPQPIQIQTRNEQVIPDSPLMFFYELEEARDSPRLMPDASRQAIAHASS